MQINKGNSHFHNYTNSLQRIISKEKPDIIAISESNILYNDKNSFNDFPEYNHELNLMSKVTGISCNSIMVRKNINYSRRYELGDNVTCNIVIEVKVRGNRNINVIGGYRQWQVPKQLGINYSK